MSQEHDRVYPERHQQQRQRVHRRVSGYRACHAAHLPFRMILMPLVLCLCCAELSSAVSPDTPFMQQGRHVKAALTKTGLKWQYCSMKLWPTQPANGSSESGNMERCNPRLIHDML